MATSNTGIIWPTHKVKASLRKKRKIATKKQNRNHQTTVPQGHFKDTQGH